MSEEKSGKAETLVGKGKDTSPTINCIFMLAFPYEGAQISFLVQSQGSVTLNNDSSFIIQLSSDGVTNLRDALNGLNGS